MLPRPKRFVLISIATRLRHLKNVRNGVANPVPLNGPMAIASYSSNEIMISQGIGMASAYIMLRFIFNLKRID